MSGKHPDAVVIGAGAIGLFTAWRLAEAGLRVLVLERGEVGREASWAGGGILSPLHPWRYPEAVLALARWSQGVYPQLCETLRERTGIDPQWTTGGMLILEPESVPEARRWAGSAPETVEILDAGQQALRFPGVMTTSSAILLPAVAQLRNPRLLQALQAQLRALGVAFRTGLPAERLRVDKGRAVAVQTREGEIGAACFVVAAGAWSGSIAPLAIPVEPVKGQMLLYAVGAATPPVMLLREHSYLIPRRDGRVLAGSSVEYAGFDKTPDAAMRRQLHEGAVALFPQLATGVIEAHWAGLRPGSPRGIPFICRHPEIAGVYLNTGHFRHGLLTAPASAQLLADLVLQRQPFVNPADYQMA
ncbi:MAG TPA: glycine oxidase ThiO [Nevskiales bacterium]|nr:glycine oxidase ThiO [Nevskiales bacterium]